MAKVLGFQIEIQGEQRVLNTATELGKAIADENGVYLIYGNEVALYGHWDE